MPFIVRGTPPPPDTNREGWAADLLEAIESPTQPTDGRAYWLRPDAADAITVEALLDLASDVAPTDPVAQPIWLDTSGNP